MILGLALGCSEAPAVERRDSNGVASRTADAREVAVVDGAPILLDQVATTASELQIPPREALERLIGEQLLIGEAERRGIGDAPEVSQIARQAAVQAVLEKLVESVVIGDQEVTEAYQRQRERFEVPEKRASLHVLFALNRKVEKDRDEAAMRHAQGALRELLEAPEPRAIWERYRQLGNVDEFPIKAEEIPPASRSDNFAPEYLDGLFSLSEAAVVPNAVRTDFGWHAIVVTEIVPARNTPLVEAHATLRAELMKARRSAALDELVHDLSMSHPVERNEAAIDGVMRAQDEASGAPGP